MLRVNRDTFSRRFRRLSGRLAPEDVDAFIEVLERQEVAAGEAVITYGAPVDALLLVWDGELNVTVETPSGDRELAHVGPGAFLGEASLLDPGPASATVTADQGCTVLRLTRAAFDSLCADEPRLANVLLEELARVLAARVRTAGERLDDLLAGESALSGDVVGVGARLHGGHA